MAAGVPRPELASGSRAGQFVHVRTGDYSGLVLRRPFSLNTADAATGIVTIHFRIIGRGTDWFTRLRPGDPIDMLGPLGRPFEVDPRSRHLLLIAGGLGMAGVRMLADEAIRDGRQVTLLFGAASAREVYPSSLLPDEVEYVVATDDGSLGHHGFVTELVPEYEAWADQAFACGPAPMLAALARLAAGRRERLGVAKLGRKRGGGKADPSGRRRRAGRRSSRCRWSRTWAARSGRAWAAWSWARRRDAAAGLPRGAGVRAERSLGGRLVKAKRRSWRVDAARAARAAAAADASAADRSRPPVVAPPDVDLSVDLGRGLVLPTRSSSRRARSATASSTATSSRSIASARSAARARRSSRASATRRRG